MDIAQEAKKMKSVSPIMAASSEDVRNRALEQIAKGLYEHREEIFAANKKDLEAAESSGVAGAVMKRLKYDDAKLADSISGLAQLQKLPDPVGRRSLYRELDEGLVLSRVTVPIGVIGVIFEARPDAMIQVAGLCIKSGNCAILKGGKETACTNRVLFGIIRSSALEAGLPDGCLLQAELHNEIDELLACDEDVDLIIPRGSNRFVRYIMENTKIPVMGHSSGICHVYVDSYEDIDEAVRLIIDAKTQYPAACNAAETVLVKRSIAADILPVLAAAFKASGVAMNASPEAQKLIAAAGFEAGVMADADFYTEYGDMIISIKLVEDVREAAEHINRYGSHHTDCIITDDKAAEDYFLKIVDSAGVYVNCSTRFADGFRYGFGAEVGISTGKIHARGPVGLEGLVTYKYLLKGSGHIVGDYASGKRTFNHKDL